MTDLVGDNSLNYLIMPGCVGVCLFYGTACLFYGIGFGLYSLRLWTGSLGKLTLPVHSILALHDRLKQSGWVYWTDCGAIINSSLESGVLPTALKETGGYPLLRKT